MKKEILNNVIKVDYSDVVELFNKTFNTKVDEYYDQAHDHTQYHLYHIHLDKFDHSYNEYTIKKDLNDIINGNDYSQWDPAPFTILSILLINNLIEKGTYLIYFDVG